MPLDRTRSLDDSAAAPRRRADEALEVRERLLRWYGSVARPLPWRRTRDPYAIWISEVMLQQTRVETVAGYYRPFLERFPDLLSLARAEEDEVLALWSGLGYYRRARNLQRAARRLVAQGGRWPTTAREWEALPGVGRYTAAAVASIAFGESIPAIDGNVERVAARYLAARGDPRRQPLRRRLIAAVESWLDAARPGTINQALMELGATICRPKRPRCTACPLVDGCRAWRLGEPQSYPPPRRRRAVERVERTVAVVQERRRVLLFRRPEGEPILSGLWELPSVPTADPAGDPAEALGRRYGGHWRLGVEGARIRHAITYRDIRLRVHEAEVDGLEEAAAERQVAWVTMEEAAAMPMSSWVDKVFATLERPASTGSRSSRRGRGSRRTRH